MVAGAMLLLNKVAMALFIGFGPLFVLSLLFEQTKQLFSKWLYYGIGTMFSLAVLSVMVALATKMIGAVALAFLGKYAASGFQENGEGINSMALQQGGIGLIMTTLIITAPPMAASFFQGMLGQFTAYSGFGGIGRGTGADSAGRTPGIPGYAPQPITQPEISGRNALPPSSGNLALTGASAGSYVANPDVVRTGSNAPRGG